MSDSKISALLASALISSPMALPATIPSSAETQIISNNILSESSPSARLSARRMKHQLAAAPVLKQQPQPSKGVYVGELQEKWQFPSDHLPIGMTFENIHFASWNVLDAEYMSWVTEKDSQGLKRSMIGKEHVYIGDSNLTIRDQRIAGMIARMTTDPSHPRSFIALQECSQPLAEELRSRVPLHFEIVSHHGDTIILDKRCFDLIEAKEVSGIFSVDSKRTIQEVLIRRLDNGEVMRLINTHLPGDPTKPTPSEFAAYLKRTTDPLTSTIVMGDMNFDENEMGDALEKHQTGFSLYSPYCTNISPFTFRSKAIDFFFVSSAKSSPVILNSPDEVIEGTLPMAALLTGEPFDPNRYPRAFQY